MHDGIVDESAIAEPERFAGKTVAVVGLFSPYRKSNPLAELFAQYGASDYAGLVDALAQRRSAGPLHLRSLPLDG